VLVFARAVSQLVGAVASKRVDLPCELCRRKAMRCTRHQNSDGNVGESVNLCWESPALQVAQAQLAAKARAKRIRRAAIGQHETVLLPSRDSDNVYLRKRVDQPRLPQISQVTVTELTALAVAEAVNVARCGERKGMQRVCGDGDDPSTICGHT